MQSYTVTGTKAYLELNDKDPEEVEEYAVDFAPVLGDGVALANTPSVEVEAAGNAETPVELVAQNESLSPVSPSSLDTAVRFFLRGGTAGCRYRGKIKCDVAGETTGAPTRTVVKRFFIVVEPT